MPKKSYKITGGHHTRTNAKNVKRNQGEKTQVASILETERKKREKKSKTKNKTNN